MKTVVLNLEDSLVRDFEESCRDRGDSESEVASRLLTRFLAVQQLRQKQNSEGFAVAYGQLAEDDISLAESGIEAYNKGLAADDVL